jgi:hypothetical protein
MCLDGYRRVSRSYMPFPHKSFRLKIWSILYPVILFIAGEGGVFLFYLLAPL